jgi:hypothetical protein
VRFTFVALEISDQAVADFDLHQWFTTDELEPCIACGERAVILSRESGMLFCLECGHIHSEVDSPHEGT